MNGFDRFKKCDRDNFNNKKTDIQKAIGYKETYNSLDSFFPETILIYSSNNILHPYA